VRLTVQDAGVGLAPRPWTEFSKHSTPLRLKVWDGLSVSRSIIERHHGRLCAAPNDVRSHVFIFYSCGPASATGARSLGVIGTPAVKDAKRVQGIVMVRRSLVSVVDDDESVRESLPDLLQELALRPCVLVGEEFLTSDYVDQTRCLILDIAMPGMTGPDLQRELKLRRKEIPIVFITAHRDETVRPQVLEQGAVECLFKPFSERALVEALNAALRVS